jgi:hypothetical protein
MDHRFQFNIEAILKATIWLAVACLLLRITARATTGVPIGFGNILYIGAASAFVLAPFVAIGAFFDRAGTGLLCGLLFIAAIALASRGL